MTCQTNQFLGMTDNGCFDMFSSNFILLTPNQRWLWCLLNWSPSIFFFKSIMSKSRPHLMASAWEFQVLVTFPSVCLFAGTLADLLPVLLWPIDWSRDLSDGPERRTSSKAGGGVDDDDEDEGRLRDSPSSLLARGRKDTSLDRRITH